MKTKRKNYFSDPTVAITSAIVIFLILVVGVYAMTSDVSEAKELASNFRKYQQEAIADYYHCHYCNTILPCPLNHNGIKKPCPNCGFIMDIISASLAGSQSVTRQNTSSALDYYNCPNCNTIVTCPLNHNGIRRPCPSCGVMMDIVSKSIAAAQNGFWQNTNLSGVPVGSWGGRNGGYGLGPVGNLVCPSCGTVIPHQRAVPAYSVNCPQCGSKMYRQLPANIPTAFYNNTPGSQNSLNNSAPPITSTAVMPHGYRGVCSNCHQIINQMAYQSPLQQAGGNYPNGGARIGPGGCVLY